MKHALTVAEARAEAPSAAARLVAIAARLPRRPGIFQDRLWSEDARTFTYHTMACAPLADLTEPLTRIFLHASGLERHPWYPQFQVGSGRSLSTTERLGVARFDVGLGADRVYRQVASAFQADGARGVVLRSVDEGHLPDGAVEAYTLTPTGDVFRHADGLLSWHHILTTTGAELFPHRAERAVMNAMRRLRLDGAERRTYQAEARAFLDWIARPDRVFALASTLP